MMVPDHDHVKVCSPTKITQISILSTFLAVQFLRCFWFTGSLFPGSDIQILLEYLDKISAAEASVTDLIIG